MDCVVFYVMNRKGLSVLSAVIDRYGPDVIASVVTAKDPEMLKDYYPEIISICTKYNLPVYEINSGRIPGSAYKIAVGWRWIIDDSENLIVLHDSLLPKYRGFSPLVNTLIQGDETIGVTALFASPSYDSGEIIDQRSIEIKYPLKIDRAIELVSQICVNLVLDLLSRIANGNKFLSLKQDEKHATYSIWRNEEDYFIDWSQPADKTRRFIDAIGFPYKGAATRMENDIIRITEAEEINDVKIVNRDAGKIIFIEEGKPVVVCGQGLLKIHEVKDDFGRSLLPFKKFRIRFH